MLKICYQLSMLPSWVVIRSRRLNYSLINGLIADIAIQGTGATAA